MNTTEVYFGLRPTSPIPKVVRSLISSGVSARALAEISGVSVASVDNWLLGNTTPRTNAANHIDDVRFVFHGLLIAGLEPDTSERWFKSRHFPSMIRPSDTIKENPEAVIDLLYEQFPVLNRVNVDTDSVSILISE